MHLSSHAYVTNSQERSIEILTFWGPPGTGKTHRAMTLFGDDLFTVTPGPHCWDNYTGQATILLDEFDPERWPMNDIKRFLDKWRCELGCRYRNNYAAWTRVIICANSCPTSWYANAHPTDLAAFRRRLGGGCWNIQAREESFSTADGTIISTQPGAPLASNEPVFSAVDGTVTVYQRLA